MSLAKFFDDWFKDRASLIMQGVICKIESFDQDAMTADVKPLLKNDAFGGTDDFTVIPDVPVSSYYCSDFVIKPDYQRGDLVWVSFSTYSIEKGIKGEMDSSQDMFNASDAVVIAGLQNANTPLPSQLSLPGLVIGHKDGTALIHMQDGNVKIMAGSTDKSELTVLGETLKEWLEGLITDLLNASIVFATSEAFGPSAMSADLKIALESRKSSLSDILSQAVKIG